MKYTGFIRDSRAIDLAVVNKLVDGTAASLLYFTPEQLGIPVVVYFIIRFILNITGIVLRDSR